MLCTLSDSVAGWRPVESQSQILQNVFLCLPESNTVPSIVKRVQCSPHQEMVSYHGSRHKGFNRFHKELENKDGPPGCLYLRLGGWTFILALLLIRLLDAGYCQKGTRLWERWHPSADRDSQRAIQLRAFKSQPLQQLGAEEGLAVQHPLRLLHFPWAGPSLPLFFLPGEMDCPWIVFTQDS